MDISSHRVKKKGAKNSYEDYPTELCGLNLKS
jgi:hypothetical protein